MNTSDMTLNVYNSGYISLYPSWGNVNEANAYSKLYFVVGGKIRLTIGDVSYTGGRGKLFFVPAGTKHTFRTFAEELGEKYWLHFNIDVNGNNIFSVMKLPHCVDVSQTDIPFICNLFSNILFMSRFSGTAADYFRMRASLLELLAYYCEISEVPLVQPFQEDSFSVVITYINENLGEKLTVESLAKIVHMCPNYFSHYFKKRANISPIKYINRLRMERAKYLMETTSLSFSQIAEEVGFCDVKYFGFVFKKATKFSLGDYRKINPGNIEQ